MENAENEQAQVPRSAFKEWLEKLQQESWQLELLISGFALFGIWEAKSLVGAIHDFRAINPPSADYLKTALSILEFVFSMGWRIFFINLLVHVISRGLWIGAIGLRYVSSDINFKVFNYSSKFEEYFVKRVGSFDDYIERLEKFSSVIFAFTFLLFFLFLSFMIFCFWLVLLTVFATSFISDSNASPFGGVVFLSILIFVFLIILFGLVVFIDFITLGVLKRIKDKHFSRAYFYLFRFYSIITFSFLYRPLLYNFLDEKYTRRLFLFSIPYVLLIALLPGMHSTPNISFPVDDDGRIDEAYQSESYRNYYYDDERALLYHPDRNFFNLRKPIYYVSLQSRELSGSYAQIFFRVYPRDGAWLEKRIGLSPFYKKGILFPFQNNNRKDSIVTMLEQERAEELKRIIKQKSNFRKQIRKKTIEKEQPGIIKIEGALKLDDAYWQPIQDSIERHFDNRIETAKKKKIRLTKRSLLYLNEIYIDEVPYSDSLSCHFYVHPNMGERGLLCYLPLGSIENGPNLLRFSKKRYNPSRDSLWTTVDIDIPFFMKK